MSAYTCRPWLSLYSEGRPTDIESDRASALEIFTSAAAAAPEAIAIDYFDGCLTYGELGAASDALAAKLIADGFTRGDRLGLYLQNNPAFVIGLIAAWKAGGVAVSINPMNRHAELTYLLQDSGAVALLALDTLYDDVARAVIAQEDTSVRTVITASALDYQTRNDARVFAGLSRTVPDGASDLMAVIAEYRDAPPPVDTPRPEGTAVLSYTSGTTGRPKGAMNTHANLAFNAQTYRDWIGLGGDDVVLGVAPLFHITGLVAHVMVAGLLRVPLVLAHRFVPEVMIDAVREHRPTFTVGAITAYIALADSPHAQSGDFASFRALYSGGAPIAPAVADRLEKTFGTYIHNVYGLTETNSPSHGVPYGVRAPVDPESGALSVGVPVFNTIVRVIDDNGDDVPIGEVGEFATSGPVVVSGYWNRPEATAESIPGGELRTGDMGFMDADGWFYLVDRKKDMINTSGYKVWPREVEDVLYGHPAVAEVAVVGVPDEYRGETVKAYVSLQPGKTATSEEIVTFAKERMAAYKYPRSVEVLSELPKTATGKVLRRTLRAQAVEEMGGHCGTPPDTGAGR